MNRTVPWNAAWSGEERFEVRPCRYAEGRLAIWQPFAPGAGRPLFAKPHIVRQRRTIAEMLCTVCGEHTPEGDRWWFGLGVRLDDLWSTTEAPVHRACADLALAACPHLRARGAAPARLPRAHRVLAATVGGEAVVRDFGIDARGRTIIGHLKLVWPLRSVVDQVIALGAAAEAQAA